MIDLAAVVGGKLVGLRDYFTAEVMLMPKGLRGGAPMQVDGWPPKVIADIRAIPRWLALWIFLAPILVIAATCVAVYHVDRRLDALQAHRLVEGR